MTTAGYQIQLFAQSARSPVNWRLLSGNNREVGRGSLGYADVEQALTGVEVVRGDLDRLVRKINRVEPNRWRWELSLAGTPVAVAGHAFDRLIRCELAVRQFTAEFAGASIRPGVVVSNARRWERAS